MPPLEDEVPEGEFDAGDPKQVNRRKARAKQRAAADDEVLISLLASFKGRSWLWRQLSVCHIFETSWRATDGEAAMAFREGERNVGLRLLAHLMRASPDSFILMMKENSNGG